MPDHFKIHLSIQSLSICGVHCPPLKCVTSLDYFVICQIEQCDILTDAQSVTCLRTIFWQQAGDVHHTEVILEKGKGLLPTGI